MDKYQILLFYKFVEITNSEKEAVNHLAYCKSLGVKGRILIADEGINGTISGTIEQTEAYMREMHSNPLYSDMEFKIDPAEEHAFRKIFVRHRKELVTLEYKNPINPAVTSGKRLDPIQFHEYLQRDDVIVVDGRNDYEYDLGHFRNAIKPEVETFKEFPDWINENLSEFKDRPILTYCTGGIRCEKLTSVLLDQGFTDVYQLDGGIVTYGKDPEVEGKLFDGKCYVFDERMSVTINHTDEDTLITACKHCHKPSAHYINCTNNDCDAQYICCEDCEEEMQGFCSSECKEIEHAL
nr:rhodanese-related sulfurtransferase [Paenibacillus antarcticus]